VADVVEELVDDRHVRPAAADLGEQFVDEPASCHYQSIDVESIEQVQNKTRAMLSLREQLGKVVDVRRDPLEELRRRRHRIQQRHARGHDVISLGQPLRQNASRCSAPR
jgi:hypothetical protein